MLVSILFGSITTFTQNPALGVQSVTVAWDPSTDPTVAGYNVYYGSASGVYTNEVSVGNVTTATVSNLLEGVTYFFVATAYNTSGLESIPSNEVSYSVPGTVGNQPPTLSPLGNLAFNEGAGQQTVNLSGITSGATNQALTITAVSSNPGLIPNPTVNYASPNTTGTLTLLPVAFAYGTVTITVTLDNGQATNNTTSQTFTVTVNPVNQPPTLNPLSNVTINENAGLQTVNLSGITSGATNEIQTLTVTATSSNPSLIPNPTVNYLSPNTTGTLTFAPAANAFGTATITVTVNDGGASNNITTQTFTVTVNWVNQPPTLNPIGNVTINENAGPQTVNLSGITPGPPNETQTLTVTATSSNPALIPNPTVTYTSPNTTGKLTFTPVTNAFGTATITVTVNDGGATNNITTQTFTVTVNWVNQPPTLNPLGNVTINENAGLQTVNLSGITSGAANEFQTLTVTAASSNPGLIPNPTVTYTSPDTTGALNFATASNAFGAAAITVTVNDGGASNNLVTRSFTVTVNANVLTISTITNQATTQNIATEAIQFTIGDSQVAASNLTLYASSSNPTLIADTNIVFGGSDSNRTVTLIPSADQNGTADITVTVSDGSVTASNIFQLIVRPPPSAQPEFVLVTSGNGTVWPALNLLGLKPGGTYTLTAIPAAGQLFAGWSGDIPGPAPKVTFTLASNILLQANFVPDPFVPAAGTYNGLFNESDAIQQYSAGFFTVSVTTRGTYTGRLQIGANRYSFSGKLNLQCQATNLIPRLGANPLTVQLSVGAGNQAGQIFGLVTDGTWISTLSGDRAVFNSKTNPAPYAGSYTLIVPGQDNNPLLPTGDGFGTVQVDGNGVARFAGTLADGTKVTQSVPLSQDGFWPLYVPLYSGQGSMMSWLSFTNQTGSDLSGLLNWIKPANLRTVCYPSGFTNACEAIGSAYVPPAGATNYILNLTEAAVTFSGGNLASDFANSVALGLSSKVTNQSSNRLTLSFSLSTGTFSGKATDPSSGKSLSFNGAVLQKLNAGYGFLLGTNQSSRVTVTPPAP